MKKVLGQIILLLVIILTSIFPLQAFAEGEIISPSENLNLNADTPQVNETNSLYSTASLQSSNENLAANTNGKISGFVWNDANKDGVFQSETEKPIGGISVYLYNYGIAKSSTTTLNTGDFSFTGLASSSYEIVISSNNFGTGSKISTKFNWNSTSKNNNFSEKSGDVTSWSSGIITIGAGETLINFGCGVYDPTRLEIPTPAQEAATNTNPKTADETLYFIPLLGIFGSIGLLIISKRKINSIK